MRLRDRQVLELRAAGKTYREIWEWWEEGVNDGNRGHELPKCTPEQAYYQGRRMVQEAKKAMEKEKR
jgi:hypothetical protein